MTMNEPNDAPQSESITNQEGKKKKPHSRPTIDPIRSISELLRAVYGGKQKRVVVKKADIQAMRSAPKLEPAERQELLELAASDRTLERTRELMLMSMEWSDAPYIVDCVFDFARQVFRCHPAFLDASLESVFENTPESPREDRAVRALQSQSFSALHWQKGAPELKKNEIEQCRTNAFSCLLIWFRKKREMSIERILRLLQGEWATAASRFKGDVQKLRALLGARDAAAVAIACSVLDEQVTIATQQAASARRAEERMQLRVTELEEKLLDTTEQLNTAKTTIEKLEGELVETRRTHSDTLAHMRDDYEELRGRVLHRLKEELSLLDEGLHALRRDPPKVHVMIDHAERAVDGLKREMDRLRGGE